jgi:tRNA nucleotidyltransferase (CCA-adding enzyme)
MLVVDYAAGQDLSLPIRFAALLHDLGKGATPAAMWPRHHGHEALGTMLVETVSARLKVPAECRDLAVMTAREHGNVGRAAELRPATIINLFERCDAFRRPQRFLDMLRASACDHFGRTGFEQIPFPQEAYLQAALFAAQKVDAGQIASALQDQPQHIPHAVRSARVDAVQHLKQGEIAGGGC